MNEPTRILGVDLDDVVIDCNAALCRWHNQRYGTSYERKDIVSYELAKIWRCTPEESIERCLRFYHTDEHHTAASVQGAIAGLQELRKQNTLVAVTSRPESVRDLTLAWLRKQGAEVFDAMHFLGHYHEPVEKRISKAEVCKQVGVALFIEDSFAHATAIACVGIPVLLLDSPWNQGAIPELVTRVFSWEEILDRAVLP